MSFRLQVFILILSILFMLYLFSMIIKDKVSLKYSLSWIIVFFLVFVFSIFPKSIDTLSETFGIYNPVNALFFVGFIFLLVIVYSMTIVQSRMSEKIKNMAQYIAIQDYINKT